jgi:hypothetical protein
MRFAARRPRRAEERRDLGPVVDDEHRHPGSITGEASWTRSSASAASSAASGFSPRSPRSDSRPPPTAVNAAVPLRGTAVDCFAMATASSAERIVAVLEACAASAESIPLAALVRATGLPKTTVHRLCAQALRARAARGLARRLPARRAPLRARRQSRDPRAARPRDPGAARARDDERLQRQPRSLSGSRRCSSRRSTTGPGRRGSSGSRCRCTARPSARRSCSAVALARSSSSSVPAARSRRLATRSSAPSC